MLYNLPIHIFMFPVGGNQNTPAASPAETSSKKGSPGGDTKR